MVEVVTDVGVLRSDVEGDGHYSKGGGVLWYGNGTNRNRTEQDTHKTTEQTRTTDSPPDGANPLWQPLHHPKTRFAGPCGGSGTPAVFCGFRASPPFVLFCSVVSSDVRAFSFAILIFKLWVFLLS